MTPVTVTDYVAIIDATEPDQMEALVRALPVDAIRDYLWIIIPHCGGDYIPALQDALHDRGIDTTGTPNRLLWQCCTPLLRSELGFTPGRGAVPVRAAVPTPLEAWRPHR